MDDSVELSKLGGDSQEEEDGDNAREQHNRRPCKQNEKMNACEDSEIEQGAGAIL